MEKYTLKKKIIDLVEKNNKINKKLKIDNVNLGEVQDIINLMNRKITINITIYDTENKKTDFEEILKKDPNKKLFIYNDNFFSYLVFTDIKPGGGNGFLRPYRQDRSDIKNPHGNIFALGLPTGLRHNMHVVTIPYFYIDKAINNIEAFIRENKNITDIYYSAENDEGDIGLNIFKEEKWSVENIAEITKRLKNMFKKLELDMDVEYKIIK